MESVDDDPDVVERCPKSRYVRYNELLGRGAWKTVYKGFDEVQLLKTLKHDNIIKSYVSWVDDEKKRVNMITELFISGDLRQYREKHRSVDLKAIKIWARQILQGLVYLHGHQPPIIHRDLKCNNIFVNGNHGQVKIGDLGFATLMLRPTAKSLIGTPEFMAPELYEEEYNELVDIYSFGMCILELITCEYPYSECRNPAHIYKKVISGIKPAALSKVEDLQAKELIEKCLVPASQRLPAKELLKDPFLAPESIKDNPVEVDLSTYPMDIDDNYNMVLSLSGSSCVKSKTTSTCLPSLELQRVNERNDIRLKGEMNEDNTVALTLRIADFSGGVRNIDFPFSLDDDTSNTIAQEMVEQLDLLHEDVIIIAELIDDMIMKFVPTWKPSLRKKSIPVGGVSLTEGSLIVQNSRIACRPTKVPEPEDPSFKGSDKSLLFTYLGDSMKSSEVFCYKKITSNDSVLCEDNGEKDAFDDLKKELDNIEAQYLCWHSELQKFRDAAIEDAKRKWNLKNKDARSLFALRSLDEKNDIRFKGERNEENTVTLPLRIADFRGGAKRK
ncbi:putative protein kinase WNK-NRBP family [Helianthus debilis subsp. tardiflorus]